MSIIMLAIFELFDDFTCQDTLVLLSLNITCCRHLDGSNYINFVMSDLATKSHCV